MSEPSEDSWEEVETQHLLVDSSNVPSGFGYEQGTVPPISLNSTLFSELFSLGKQKQVCPLVKVDSTWFKSMIEPVIGTSLFIQVNPSKAPNLKKDQVKLNSKPAAP